MGKTKTGAAAHAKELKKGTTHLALLLDESGSMNGNQEAVVTSVNEFLHTFAEAETKDAKVRVWLGQFDKHPGAPRVRIEIEGERVGKVPHRQIASYQPRGLTPLYDAVVDTIAAMDKAVGKKERAFVVILTDGYENASENSAETVAALIKKREKDGWAFLYLGANQDVTAVAGDIGLDPIHALTFTSTPKGTSAAVTRTTDRAMAYAASASATDYAALASADHARTGGVVAEDGEEES